MNIIKVILLISSVFILSANLKAEELPSVTVEKTGTLDEAFRGGIFSGQFGLYYETKDLEGKGRAQDDSYSNAWFMLKYETAKWNNIQFGAEIYAATKLYDDDGDFGSDFEGDDNTPTALSQLYVKYHFTEKSFLIAGRFYHKKFSYLDDAQSEGLHLQYNEIEDLSVRMGFMTQFAEMDYDDFEDFGQEDGSQKLSSERYGTNSTPYVVYLDLIYKINEHVTSRPYVYHQDGYASVYGMDLDLETAINESSSIGTKAIAYSVLTDSGAPAIGDDDTGKGDSNEVFGAKSWLKMDSFLFSLNLFYFSGGAVKPEWFKDYLPDFDQAYWAPVNADAGTSISAIETAVDYKYKAFKVRYGIAKWEGNDKSQVDAFEHELIFGYKFTEELDAALRFYIVDQHVSTTRDYEKIEARLRYKF